MHPHAKSGYSRFCMSGGIPSRRYAVRPLYNQEDFQSCFLYSYRFSTYNCLRQYTFLILKFRFKAIHLFYPLSSAPLSGRPRLVLRDAKVCHRACRSGLKCISRKFFLLAERNWQEKPPREAVPIAVDRIHKTPNRLRWEEPTAGKSLTSNIHQYVRKQ